MARERTGRERMLGIFNAPQKIPPSDRGDAVSRRFKDGEIDPDELYDEYTNAGLSPEEADEMCNLMDQDD